MIKKANINWTAKQLSKMIDKDTINFDNAVQRGYVWDNKRKSLLIDSMIVGYPIPAMYAAKDENGYSMLDGKQRSNAVHSFINNEFALDDVPDYEDENGQLVELNGKHFDDLSEDIKDNIMGYSLTVYYFDGITDDEVSEMFYRLNNGKPLSAFDLMRVKIKDHAQIKKLSEHKIFNTALTEKALANNKAEELAMKAWAVLYMDHPSFNRKELQPVLETASISDDEVNEINSAFDRLSDAYTLIADTTGKDAAQIKIDKRVLKHIFAKTHFLSLVPFAIKSVKDNVSVDLFAMWLGRFYSGKKKATISDDYNENASRGSSDTSAIEVRENALKADYVRFTDNPPEIVHADTVNFNENAYHAFVQQNNGQIINTNDNEHPIAFEDVEEEDRKRLYVACKVEKDRHKYEDTIIDIYNRHCDENPDEADSSVA